jgi:hypothetical protein
MFEQQGSEYQRHVANVTYGGDAGQCRQQERVAHLKQGDVRPVCLPQRD